MSLTISTHALLSIGVEGDVRAALDPTHGPDAFLVEVAVGGGNVNRFIIHIETGFAPHVSPFFQDPALGPGFEVLPETPALWP